jgi:anaerobic selenocysteine-containing dehydrogenase
MNQYDMNSRDIKDGDVVDLFNNHDGIERRHTNL